MKVEVIKEYKDLEQGKRNAVGLVFECSKERGDFLKTKGFVKELEKEIAVTKKVVKKPTKKEYAK